jgi:hypothetical protein
LNKEDKVNYKEEVEEEEFLKMKKNYKFIIK